MPFYSRTGSVKIYDGNFDYFRALNEQPVYNIHNSRWYFLNPRPSDPTAIPQYQFKLDIENDFKYPIPSVDLGLGQSDNITYNNTNISTEFVNIPITGYYDQDLVSLFENTITFYGAEDAVLDTGLMQNFGDFLNPLPKPDLGLGQSGNIVYNSHNIADEYLPTVIDPGTMDQNILYTKYNISATFIDIAPFYGAEDAVLDTGFIQTQADFLYPLPKPDLGLGQSGNIVYNVDNVAAEFLPVLPDPGETDQDLTTNFIDTTPFYGAEDAVLDTGYHITALNDWGEDLSAPEYTFGEDGVLVYWKDNWSQHFYGGWRFDQDYIINSTNVATMFI